MTGNLTIALDAMGGDQAPDMVIGGAALARERFPELDFLVFGDEARVRPAIDGHPGLAEAVELRHTSEFVTGEAKPSQALRSGRQSSMRLAIDAVRDGEASAVVSAGNTGALMAMSKIVLRTLPGIDRPAMVSWFPSVRGEVVMLDLGANIDCNSSNLVQFAVMGAMFARAVQGLVEPSVGLLNVGEEELKGNDAVKAAHGILRDAALPIRFHGFVEGDDIAAGTVDVVVTDGFTGNVALKTTEGMSRLYQNFLRETFASSLAARIGYLFARGALDRLRVRTDPRRYNGAVFVGLNGVSVKSHGRTDALGFATAVGVARDLAVNGFIDRIREELETLDSAIGDDDRQAVS